MIFEKFQFTNNIKNYSECYTCFDKADFKLTMKRPESTEANSVFFCAACGLRLQTMMNTFIKMVVLAPKENKNE